VRKRDCHEADFPRLARAVSQNQELLGISLEPVAPMRLEDMIEIHLKNRCIGYAHLSTYTATGANRSNCL
jgi:hypothetical protein